jgi:glucose-6-phosphate 1-epimerase
MQNRDGASSLPRIRLAHPSGAVAEVSPFGAHVTSWVPAGAGEALFLSRAARFDGRTAIRGGAPVIFPQFADRGPLPKHGFARTSLWRLVDGGDGAASATFELRDDERTRAVWPHAFAATLTVEVHAAALAIRLALRNTGDAPFDFTAALHTYLRVADVRRASVIGLRGCAYADSLCGGEPGEEREDALRIEDEIDRIYLSTPRELRVDDPAGGRTLRVRAEGFADTVVWNPGARGAAALADMEAGEERVMLCIEAAQVGHPIHLPPGESWSGAQMLEIG